MTLTLTLTQAQASDPKAAHGPCSQPPISSAPLFISPSLPRPLIPSSTYPITLSPYHPHLGSLSTSYSVDTLPTRADRCGPTMCVPHHVRHHAADDARTASVFAFDPSGIGGLAGGGSVYCTPSAQEAPFAREVGEFEEEMDILINNLQSCARSTAVRE